MEIKNYTGKLIQIKNKLFPIDGNAYIERQMEKINTFDGIDFMVPTTERVVGLPKQKPFTILIVNDEILNHLPERDDLVKFEKNYFTI